MGWYVHVTKKTRAPVRLLQIGHHLSTRATSPWTLNSCSNILYAREWKYCSGNDVSQLTFLLRKLPSFYARCAVSCSRLRNLFKTPRVRGITLEITVQADVLVRTSRTFHVRATTATTANTTVSLILPHERIVVVGLACASSLPKDLASAKFTHNNALVSHMATCSFSALRTKQAKCSCEPVSFVAFYSLGLSARDSWMKTLLCHGCSTAAMKNASFCRSFPICVGICSVWLLTAFHWPVAFWAVMPSRWCVLTLQDMFVYYRRQRIKNWDSPLNRACEWCHDIEKIGSVISFAHTVSPSFTVADYPYRFRLLLVWPTTLAGVGYSYRYRFVLSLSVSFTVTGYFYRYQLLLLLQTPLTVTGFSFRC